MALLDATDTALRRVLVEVGLTAFLNVSRVAVQREVPNSRRFLGYVGGGQLTPIVHVTVRSFIVHLLHLPHLIQLRHLRRHRLVLRVQVGNYPLCLFKLHPPIVSSNCLIFALNKVGFLPQSGDFFHGAVFDSGLCDGLLLRVLDLGIGQLHHMVDSGSLATFDGL